MMRQEEWRYKFLKEGKKKKEIDVYFLGLFIIEMRASKKVQNYSSHHHNLFSHLKG